MLLQLLTVKIGNKHYAIVYCKRFFVESNFVFVRLLVEGNEQQAISVSLAWRQHFEAATVRRVSTAQDYRQLVSVGYYTTIYLVSLFIRVQGRSNDFGSQTDCARCNGCATLCAIATFQRYLANCLNYLYLFSFVFNTGVSKRSIVLGFSGKPKELLDVEAIVRSMNYPMVY